MSTVRRGPMAADSFTTISNAFARDARLSFKARGVGLWLFSQANGWRLSIRSIAAQNGCGTESVMTALQELETYGYLRREPQSRDSGRFGDVDYIVTDLPAASGESEHGGRVRADRVRADRVRETGTHKKPKDKEDQGQEDQVKTPSPDGDDALFPEFAQVVQEASDREQERVDAALTPAAVRAANEAALNAEFETRFWPAYPRKVGKEAARKAYRRTRRGGVTVDELVSGVARFATEKATTEKRFIAHASTWLSAGRWADEPEEPTATPGGHQPYRDDEWS